MPTDRRLARDFWLHEFRGWERATPTQVAELERLVRGVLQPARRRWGRIGSPTGQMSWIQWKSGEMRTGSHATGGAVDFVPLDADLEEVHQWIATHLPGQFGTVIFERDHIHVTASGIQGREGVVYTEPSEGVYELGVALPMTLGLILLAGILLAIALRLLATGAP